jgi:hypothetical protein
MTSRVDCFHPKLFGCSIVVQHGSCKSDQGLVLVFHYSILLRCVGGEEFMLDAFFIALFFNVHVLEFGAVVTSDLHNLSVVLPLSSSCKCLEDP